MIPNSSVLNKTKNLLGFSIWILGIIYFLVYLIAGSSYALFQELDSDFTVVLWLIWGMPSFLLLLYMVKLSYAEDK